MTRIVDPSTEEPRASRSTGPRRLALLVALAFVVLGLLGACTSSTQDAADSGGDAPAEEPPAEEPPAEEPPAEEPPAEEPPAEEPAPEQPPTDSGEGTTEDGLSSEDWVLIIILGVLALIIIMAVTSMATSHSDSKDQSRSALNQRLGDVVGNARWIHDQGSIEVLRQTDAEQLRSVWNNVRSRMVDLEGRISVLASGTGSSQLDQSLTYLGQTVAGLRGALETNVSVRLGPDASSQTDLVQSTSQTVSERRQQLSAAIAPVSAAMR